MSDSNSERLQGRAIALVSGKGGSGKTIVAAVMAKVLGLSDVAPLLVDADLGTAGLSFYLGLDLVANTTRGLSDAFRHDRNGALPSDAEITSWIQLIKVPYPAYFLSAGDHRRYPRDISDGALNAVFEQVIHGLKRSGEAVIVDCRGGIDNESLAACRAVDDIILIVETDTTSFQASQYLVEVLGENNIASKLRGFIVNKVFEDPTSIVRNGTGLFRCQCLGAIPLDLDAMRDFFSGRVPPVSSIFGKHVHFAICKGYPEALPLPSGRPFDFREYSEVGLTNLDSVRGGILSAMAIIMAIGFYIAAVRPGFGTFANPKLDLAVASLAVFGLLGSLNNTRKAMGRVIDVYVKVFLRLAERRRD